MSLHPTLNLRSDQGRLQRADRHCREGHPADVRQGAGLRQLHGLVDAGDHKVVSISIWETREAAQKSEGMAASWIKENIADAFAW